MRNRRRSDKDKDAARSYEIHVAQKAMQTAGVGVDGDHRNQVYYMKLDPGLIVLDTGCRRACGGRLLHEALRGELDNRGIAYDTSSE